MGTNKTGVTLGVSVSIITWESSRERYHPSMRHNGGVVDSSRGGLIGTASYQGEDGCRQVARRHRLPRGVERRLCTLPR